MQIFSGKRGVIVFTNLEGLIILVITFQSLTITAVKPIPNCLWYIYMFRRWMNSDMSLSHLNGFFLRLRLGKMEAGLGEASYYVACITGMCKYL